MFISVTEPWFAATPDALVVGANGIVEVKCPFLCKDRCFDDVGAEKKSQFCIEKVESAWRLRQGHQYFTQVQMQLFASGADYCDFVVWSPTELHVERIVPNNDFISSTLTVMRDFYFE
eukprot:scpid99045/ scgid9592/ 